MYGYCPGWYAGGVSLELYRELVLVIRNYAYCIRGVGGMEDIQALENMGISAVIVGKAFYEKNVEFKI
ncbi:MAG: HisA/HisF-related TIM barrel protein [Butyricimonas faecalis]